MAITTLNNMSIQTAGPGSNQGLLMPKLKYRFRVLFLGFGTTASTELTKQVVDVSRPKVGFEEIELPIYNSKVYMAGKYTLEPVTINVRDDASNNVIKLVGQQIQKQFDFFEQSSARSGIDYKFTTKVEILDGGNGANEPVILETFEMYGCFLQNADYGDLNYGTNEAAQIALTIRFDNLIQTPRGTGVGTAVARQTATAAATGGSQIFTL
jgi:hypothetical protein